jgi:hypothetical protein
MLAILWPSLTSAIGRVLGVDTTRGLLARDPAERGADRHPDTGEIALAEHVASHDLPRGKNVRRRLAVRRPPRARSLTTTPRYVNVMPGRSGYAKYGGVSSTRAQCVFGGVNPSVTQSSSTV